MEPPNDERPFRVWRLLGVIAAVIVLLALASAAVDLMVIER